MKASPLFDLTGRKAVVIGGTSGIGEGASIALATAGAHVVPTGRRIEEVETVVAKIRALDRESLAMSVDVRDHVSLKRLCEEVERSIGPVDILVNAAGVTKRLSTLTMPEEQWSDVLATNLTGTLRACQIFGARMVARGSGRIVNIASLSSFIAFHEVAAYCASKTAVAALTRSLAVEFAQHGVLVNAIAPGVFPTALNRQVIQGTLRGREILMRTPMHRFGRVEEIAGAVVFLASEASAFMTGQIIAVDGGYLASGVNR